MSILQKIRDITNLTASLSYNDAALTPKLLEKIVAYLDSPEVAEEETKHGIFSGKLSTEAQYQLHISELDQQLDMVTKERDTLLVSIHEMMEENERVS